MDWVPLFPSLFLLQALNVLIKRYTTTLDVMDGKIGKTRAFFTKKETSLQILINFILNIL